MPTYAYYQNQHKYQSGSATQFNHRLRSVVILSSHITKLCVLLSLRVKPGYS